VATRSIPVGEELGGERYVNVVIFRDTAEEVARDVELITDGDAFDWADLIFPLSRHNFGICSRDLNSGIKASLVMSISDSAAEGNVGTGGAVVGTLGTGVTIDGPAEGLLGELGVLRNESVLLLDTIPGFLAFDLCVIEDLGSEVSEVGIGGNKLGAGIVIPVEGLAHDKDIVSLSEGVSVVGNWLDDDLRLVSDSLVG
jgi:hypothetical protein